MFSLQLIAFGLLTALLAHKRQLSLFLTLVLSLLILAAGIWGLGHPVNAVAASPWLAFTPLRSWFLLVLGIVAVMSSWYRFGYHDHERSTNFWMPLFLVSMMSVILAQNVWVFMTAWESMTITSFFLVVTDHQRSPVLPAGYIYLIMSQLSATFILAGLLIMGSHLHSMNFGRWTAEASTLGLGLKSWIFALLGIGFGIKSGLVPFHIWLPRAHPVAPAPVSSLMSGAMIKLGIFGMMQFLLIDLGPSNRLWPLILLAAGAVSSLLGVLYALMEHDLKRLLAYHSIENIGIILLGVGVMAVGIDWHHPLLISMGLAASLFHTLNHAIFKSQLFLAAGAVEQHTATLDADHLGGLMRSIPGVAIGFLMGSMAISGLPPFNGFISEWLTLRALLLAASHWTGLLAVFALGVAMILGLTGALAGMCFVKASGVIFLGEPRHQVNHRPIPRSMTWPIMGMAVITLALGVAPQPFVHIAGSVDPRVALSAVSFLLPVKSTLLAGLMVLAVGLLTLVSRPWRVREVPRWACGRVPDASMQFTSASFTKAIRTTFALIYRPHRNLSKVGRSADFPAQLLYRGGTVPVWDRYLYQPTYRLVWHMSRQSTRLQAGPVRLYLTYLLATVGLMLLLLR
ncbi:MAG: proton-conducting transporter membrane subunit [Thermaerobacter sp.]|nr:proton-conducting transporter membrane subunit [Thermaerobacter sp.]